MLNYKSLVLTIVHPYYTASVLFLSGIDVVDVALVTAADFSSLMCSCKTKNV
jgi:hypothetical protein